MAVDQELDQAVEDTATWQSQGAVLVLEADIRHAAPPLKVQLQMQRAAELLQQLLDSPPKVLELPANEYQLGLTAQPGQALIEAAQRLGQALHPDSDLRFRIGVAGVHDARSPKPEELRRAHMAADAAGVGRIGLEAEVLDGHPRDWSLGSVDLGRLAEGLNLRVFALPLQAPAPAPSCAPSLQGVLAVLPPQIGGLDSRRALVGALVADLLYVALSRSALLRVLSPDSTQRLRDGRSAVQDAFDALGASHVLSGRGSLGVGGALNVDLQLSARGSAQPCWSERLQLHVEDLLLGECEPLSRAAAHVHAVLANASLEPSRGAQWGELAHFQLLSAASQWMHRLSPDALDRSRMLLDALLQRQIDAAMVWAWSAKWHVMACVQGYQPVAHAALRAQQDCERALALDPHCALALTLRGYVANMVGEDLAAAARWQALALAANPSEALGWLFGALQSVFEGELALARERVTVALALSPLDPWRYLFLDIAAHVRLASGHVDEALDLVQQALQLRAQHAPSLANLVLALGLLGRLDEAGDAARRLLRLWPQYSVARFQAAYPGRDCGHMQAFVGALRAAGLPE
ncbi:tetratricopeptide (TPR) repeat protein [Inhella inkyongensis]|uniref:Tetratricopeptide (TPR) repeat protein n=1 Tax=Inhella inkyongensis TaxID=392593 RepID=A0A840S905_9BURK|nr:hypothetical protein [Inhella inkyongensis]MBB5206008.1 tetratricopeptide (TPR) repeat protein [Inhella inkyongensis]